MNVSTIRNFLLQSPKPHSVRVTTEEEDQKLVRVKNYAKTAETIHALNPVLLECLDAKGELIRAKREGGNTAATSQEDDPELPKVLVDDAGAAAFALYAKLLARAYTHSTDVAFTKLVEILERVNERSDNIEQRLERAERNARQLAQDQIDEAMDRAAEAAEKAGEQGGENAIGQRILEGFLSGQVKAAAAKAPAPNGKGH